MLVKPTIEFKSTSLTDASTCPFNYMEINIIIDMKIVIHYNKQINLMYCKFDINYNIINTTAYNTRLIHI